MNDNFWYPRDPQRYLTDTQWCDAATEVAHVRLIDTYYALGRPIKDEQSRIQNIGKIQAADYCRVKGNLFELGWRVEDGFWRHKRIEDTMAEMKSTRTAQIQRTKAATEARQRQRDEERYGKRDEERNKVPTTTTTTTIVTADIHKANSAGATPKLTRGGEDSIRLISLCKVLLGEEEMQRWHKRWVDRMDANPKKLERVLAEVKSAITESRIKTTPARYAEQIWKEFK